MDKDHTITIRVTKPQRDKLERLAKKLDRSAGNVVRMMIDVADEQLDPAAFPNAPAGEWK